MCQEALLEDGLRFHAVSQEWFGTTGEVQVAPGNYDFI